MVAPDYNRQEEFIPLQIQTSYRLRLSQRQDIKMQSKIFNEERKDEGRQVPSSIFSLNRWLSYFNCQGGSFFFSQQENK
jgi:hypothetical protein